MHQGSGLLMNPPVVTVVGTGDSRPNRVLVDDSRSPTEFERFLVAANGIGPGNAVMPFTDLREPAWLFGALPKFA